MSYRLLGTIVTMTIGFVMTGCGRTALMLGSAEITTKLVLFWGHERIWDKVVWGRHREPAQTSSGPAVDFEA